MSSPSFACNWNTDIQLQGSKFLYTASCHKLVGDTVKKARGLEKAESERQVQVNKLSETITLKDLALDKADQRMMSWRDESYNQHERLLKQQKYAKWNDWLYFGGGVALTVLSVWAAGQLR
jgi:energy-coupling factor transporter transmembrane protein EcfT